MSSPAAVAGQVDRRAERDDDVLARQRLELPFFTYGTKTSLVPQWTIGITGKSPDSASAATPGFGASSASVGVPGDGALRVDHHHLAGIECFDGRCRLCWPAPPLRSTGICRAPAHQRADPGNLPDRRLGHEMRQPTGLADVHRVVQRVEVRDVVGRRRGRRPGPSDARCPLNRSPPEQRGNGYITIRQSRIQPLSLSGAGLVPLSSFNLRCFGVCRVCLLRRLSVASVCAPCVRRFVGPLSPPLGAVRRP